MIAIGWVAAVIALPGCGSPKGPTNPEVAPTKAVLGDPSTLKFRGHAGADPGTNGMTGPR